VPAVSAPRHRARRSGLRRAATVLAVLAVAAGGVLVGVAVSRQHGHDRAAARAAVRRAAVEHRAQSEAEAAPVSTGSSAGVSSIGAAGAAGATLVIPALGVRAPIVAEGATDGSMTIPSDIHTVGWYDGSDGTASAHLAPWPGQPGVAVLAGHVDWAGEGPGALYYLDQLVPGDPIEIDGSNGTVTDWQVRQAPLTLSKSTLPPTLFVNTGPPELALVTCGGPFDAATGHYLDNVIVWASPA